LRALGIEFFDLPFFPDVRYVLAGGVEMAGAGGRIQFDLITRA